jgi:hypothetical protein
LLIQYRNSLVRSIFDLRPHKLRSCGTAYAEDSTTFKLVCQEHWNILGRWLLDSYQIALRIAIQ